MLRRRDFVLQSAAGLTAVPALATPMLRGALRPLTAEKRARRLLARHEPDGRCLIVSDGPTAPRDLIRPAVIDRVFGTGVYANLSQPDHWCMIDADWFGRDDLFKPVPQGDPAYLVWCARYRPEVEAHDLLLEVFGDEGFSPFGVYIASCGLTLAEHPSTPRYATARVEHQWFLPELAKQVGARSDLLHCSFLSPPRFAAPTAREPHWGRANSQEGVQDV